MTTRDGGTGLGLAIAKKVMEDHHGVLLMDNNETTGACVKLKFPREYEDGNHAATSDAKPSAKSGPKTVVTDGV